ncbi:NigD-like protein [Capnocytophaga sp.]|uniref:NigD-like protein n=1 Tax=Capnocytophaga sp. TaxID=44737 RepID=UPI0026DAFC7A|nr:NigD-like protein [Capnocytophaga sp.]MDO5105016.1 NigD-like protein [Capnocytophaga sp.]
MNTSKFSMLTVGLLVFAFQSCLKNSDIEPTPLPSAVVTVRPQTDGTFFLQLDDSTKLQPTNLKTSPYRKEVRALVSYKTEEADKKARVRNVHINWIDSIRTKKPVPNLGAENTAKYGNDPIEVVQDWTTVAEDGYLTLRVRTQWSRTRVRHALNLVTNVNPNDPYEFELRHDAKGDVGGTMGDVLIAFNLNELPNKPDTGKVKLKLKWKSFSGDKSREFNLQLRQ